MPGSNPVLRPGPVHSRWLDAGREQGLEEGLAVFLCTFGIHIAINRQLRPNSKMKYEELQKIVPAGGVFRTGHLLAGKGNPAGVRRQLDRWVKSDRVRQLRRGVYQLPPLPGISTAHPFVLANALKKSSYVSLQSVLSQAGMIPEHVPVTTSVTTGRPEMIDTPAGRYQYRHVAIHLLWGFREQEVTVGQTALVATPYKALLDLLYLTPHCDDPGYLDELRLEPPDGYEVKVLDEAVDRMGSQKVRRAVGSLKKIWEES